jgi:hypothetical protein
MVIHPRRCMRNDVVEDTQHLLVIMNLHVLLQAKSTLVGFLEHGLEKHIDTPIGFNEVLEFTQHRVEVFGVLLYLPKQIGKPRDIFLITSNRHMSAKSVMTYMSVCFVADIN